MVQRNQRIKSKDSRVRELLKTSISSTKETAQVAPAIKVTMEAKVAITGLITIHSTTIEAKGICKMEDTSSNTITRVTSINLNMVETQVSLNQLHIIHHNSSSNRATTINMVPLHFSNINMVDRIVIRTSRTTITITNTIHLL